MLNGLCPRQLIPRTRYVCGLWTIYFRRDKPKQKCTRTPHIAYHRMWVTKITCDRWQRSGPIRPTLESVHFTKPFNSAPPFHFLHFGKLGYAVQCFPICVHLTRKRHKACEQSNEGRKLCPATDSGPIRPILKSVHFTNSPLFTFHLTRTRHSACEQSNEAGKFCPATDIVDLFLVLFYSVVWVLACHLSASNFDFLHFGTLSTLWTRFLECKQSYGYPKDHVRSSHRSSV